MNESIAMQELEANHAIPAQEEETDGVEQADSAEVEAIARKLLAEADALTKVHEDFDLANALEDESFADYLRRGLHMEEAYALRYADEIFAKRLEHARQKWQAEQLALQSRVGEGAAQSHAAHTDVHSMSRKQREEIARRVSRGEIITL